MGRVIPRIFENVWGEQSRSTRSAAYALACAVVLVLVCMFSWLMFPQSEDRLAEAQLLERQGDVQGALAAYTEILQSRPADHRALEGAAVCLLMLKRFDEALALQEQLASLETANVQIRVELGYNYLNHQERPADAVRVFAEAVELEPSAKHRCFLAQAQLALGAVSTAEWNLRQAISSEPNYPYAYHLLAGLLQSEGRAQEARDVVRQANCLGIDIVTETS